MNYFHLFATAMICVFSLLSCTDTAHQNEVVAEKEQMVNDFLRDYADFTALPVPPRIIEDPALRQSLNDRLDQQQAAYHTIVNEEIARRMEQEIDDEESFNNFLSATEAEIYDEDVLAYKAKIKATNQPRKLALDQLMSQKIALEQYYPALSTMNPLEAYEWLTQNQSPPTH